METKAQIEKIKILSISVGISLVLAASTYFLFHADEDRFLGNIWLAFLAFAALKLVIGLRGLGKRTESTPGPVDD